MYDIVPVEMNISYDPNASNMIAGQAKWQVFKIEGSNRTKMRNVADGYTCYCGFTNDTTFEAGVSDNDCFDDDSSISSTEYSGQAAFVVRYGQISGGQFVQLARKDFPITVIGTNGSDPVTMDWDNEFETMQWIANDGTGKWANSPVSNLFVYRGEKDVTAESTVKYTLRNVTAKYLPLGGTRWMKLTSGSKFKGKISIMVTSISEGSDNGGVTAEYTAGNGSVYVKAFRVARTSGRYRFDLMVTPKSIGYNLTTGASTASSVKVSVAMTDANGDRSTLSDLAVYGTLQYRQIGTGANWINVALTSGESEYTLYPNFSYGGIETRFVNANGDVEDYESVPISAVSNGGDAYTLLTASTNMAVVLDGVDHGRPTGSSTNTVQLLKNGESVNNAAYLIGGSDQTVSVAQELEEVTVTHSGWTFKAMLANKVLNLWVDEVDSGASSSVQLDVKGVHDGNIRPVVVSYSAVLRGPEGRSYKPVDAGLYQTGRSYTWDDDKRDFILFGWGNDEQDMVYRKYGVKSYGMTVTAPPTKKDGDANWEYVNEYSTIITNCVFGTNAVMGGFVYTSNTMSSVKTDEGGKPLIFLNGNDGSGYFMNCTVKGTVYAYSGEIGGFVIDNENIRTKKTGTNSVNITPSSIEFSGARCNSYVGGEDNVAAAFSCVETELQLRLAMALQLEASGARDLNAAVDAIAGCYSGFRRQVVAFSNMGTTALTVNIYADNDVIKNDEKSFHARSGAVILPNTNATGKLTVVLPSKPENGTEYYFKRSFGSFTVQTGDEDCISVNERNTTKRESYVMDSSYRMLYLLYYDGMWYGNLIT